METIPVLRYDPPANFIRLSMQGVEDYSSTQYNGSIQVYPFEPFNGNMAEIFQRTLLRDRIDPRHREENVAGTPEFGSGQIPGAEASFYANFVENIVGIARPHCRIVIVAKGAAAIVDASAINMSLWQRLTPELSALVRTIRVDSGAAPPSSTEQPQPAGAAVAGLYQGIKQKYMTGLTFQAGYFTPALHFYLFSKSGQVYRAYDGIAVPGGDLNRFDFDLAQRSDPSNSGRYTVKGGEILIKIGRDAIIVAALPKAGVVKIDSVVYTRR